MEECILHTDIIYWWNQAMQTSESEEEKNNKEIVYKIIENSPQLPFQFECHHLVFAWLKTKLKPRHSLANAR